MTPIAFVPSPENQVAEYLYQTPIKGLVYVAHKKFDDERGFYSELGRIPELEAYLEREFIIKQMNLSHSKPNVIRGFHAEDWSKLLSVIHGSCFCAWTDIRKDSETFGQVVTLTVGVEAPHHFGSVFVSNGIANSFCAAYGEVDYLYAVDALYAERDKSQDVAISLFDTDLAVEWPIPREQMVVSERDLKSVSMRELFAEKYK